MTLLRRVLIILSFAGAAIMGASLKALGFEMRWNSQGLAVFAMGVFFLLNGVYLLSEERPQGRGWRMVKLWFDAKERELERRAKD